MQIEHLRSKGKSEIYGLSLHPQGTKTGCYHESGTCFGVLENHVLLSFLWSEFGKRPVNYVTLKF